MSKLKSTPHIEVEINLDEMDLSRAESKATYEEIKDYVLKKLRNECNKPIHSTGKKKIWNY